MKTMSRLMLLATVAALSAAAQAAPKAAPQTAAKTATQPAKAKGIWIDVRTPEEFAEGHIQGAVNIPVDQIAGKIAAVSPNKNAPINLYCRSGRRAEAAGTEKNGLHPSQQPRRLSRFAEKRRTLGAKGHTKTHTATAVRETGRLFSGCFSRQAA